MPSRSKGCCDARYGLIAKPARVPSISSRDRTGV